MATRVTCVLFACLVVPCAAGQKLIAEFSGPVPSDGYGLDVDSTADLDGDGHPELVVGSPFDSTHGYHFGRVTIASSQDGQALLNIFGTEFDQRLGWSLAVIGDVNLDGTPDLVVGLPQASDSGGQEAGQVCVYSGLTGHLLVGIHGSTAKNQLGYGVGAIGDVTGDGVPDFGAATYQSCADLISSCLPGTAALYTGTSAGYLSGYPSGRELRPAGDVDGDGRDDYIAWDDGWDDGVRVCSGATGDVLDEWDDGIDGYFGGGPAADIDGDGRREYVFTNWSLATKTSKISVRSLGKPPLLEFEITDDHALIYDLDARADVTGDGVPDLVVGMPKAGLMAFADFLGAVRVYSITDGALLVELEGMTTGSSLWELGGVLSVLGDWNDDGVFDVVAGGSSNGDFPPFSNFVEVFSAVANPGWVSLGDSLGGAAGTPLLTGIGEPEPGSAITLGLVAAAINAPVALVLGAGVSSVSFKGGVLVPTPDLVLTALSTTDSGTLFLPAHWPTQAPAGLTVYLQAWIVDASGPKGFTATNGLVATTQ